MACWRLPARHRPNAARRACPSLFAPSLSDRLHAGVLTRRQGGASEWAGAWPCKVELVGGAVQCPNLSSTQSLHWKSCTERCPAWRPASLAALAEQFDSQNCLPWLAYRA